MIIFIYTSYISYNEYTNSKFIQTGSIFNNISTIMNNFIIILLNICNKSIFLITCLIIIFFISSIVIFLISKKYILLSIHIIIILSFIYLAFNILNFNIDNINLLIEKKYIPTKDFSDTLKNITRLIPFTLLIYLTYIYWEYIYLFINKNYNLNLTKDKIRKSIFYTLCFLSIFINLIFYYFK